MNSRNTWERRLALSVALASAALLTADSLEAFELRWRAPSPCPEEAAVREKLDTAAGKRAKSGLGFDATVTQPAAGAFKLVLHASEAGSDKPASERIVEAADCETLTTAAVVAMALALDSRAQVEPTEDTRENTRSSATQAPSRADPSRRASVPPSVAVDANPGAVPLLVMTVPELGLMLDSGSLPSLAPGIEAGASLFLGRFSTRLTGFAFPEQQASRSDGSGGRFSLLGAALLGCARSIPIPWYVTTCLGAELGQLRGTGTGVTNGRTGDALWFAPRADLSFNLPLTNSGLIGWARGGALFPLTREQFTLGGIGVVHQAASVGWRIGLGGGVSL